MACSPAGAPSEAEAAPQMAPPPKLEAARADVARMAQALRGSKRQVVVEGYADPADKDKQSASLERANRVREQLIKNGLEPAQVVALGQGEKAGQAAGVRVVEGDPLVAAPRDEKGAAANPGGSADNKDPIGASHFESGSAMTVLRGTSAMISILATKTDGEVVYLYDSESPRGNTEFPFKAVRLKNPTDSVLESGPVSVFGGGRFIGEGLSEPIPARSVAFVPFALDRQIVAVRKDEGRDSIARILSVQRGVFSCEVQHTRRIAYSLHNRLPEPAVVYVKHTVQNGYKLAKEIKQPEHLGSANLFRVDLAAGGMPSWWSTRARPFIRPSICVRPPTWTKFGSTCRRERSAKRGSKVRSKSSSRSRRTSAMSSSASSRRANKWRPTARV